jgi:hypothetical protein
MTFFVELAIVFIGFSFKDKMFHVMQEEMVKSVNLTKQPGILNTWNVIQREFECCGFQSPSDWEKIGTMIPASCCRSDLWPCPSEDNQPFADGCYQSLNKWTTKNLSILASVALVVAIFQIFGTTFSCLLAKSIKKGYDFVDD